MLSIIVVSFSYIMATSMFLFLMYLKFKEKYVLKTGNIKKNFQKYFYILKIVTSEYCTVNSSVMLIFPTIVTSCIEKPLSYIYEA